jgi:hypothetical protein
MSAALLPPASTRGTHWQRGHLACSHPARILGPAVYPPLRACLHYPRRGVEEPVQLSTAQPGVHLRVPRWERRHPAGPAACAPGPDREPTTTVCPASSKPVGQQCPLPLFPQRPRAGPIGSAGILPAATQREPLVQPSTHDFTRVCTAPDGASRRQRSFQPFIPASTSGSPAGSAGILPAQRRVRLDPTVEQPQPSGEWHPTPRSQEPLAFVLMAGLSGSGAVWFVFTRDSGERGLPRWWEPWSACVAETGVVLRSGIAAGETPALPGTAGLRFDGWTERFRGGVVCAHAGFGGAGAPPLVGALVSVCGGVRSGASIGNGRRRDARAPRKRWPSLCGLG